MLSLRELIAQQSQGSIETTEDVTPSVGVKTGRNNNNVSDNATSVMYSPKHESPATSRNSKDNDSSVFGKRKAETTLVSALQGQTKRRKPTVIEEDLHDKDDDESSSAGEEWFGDEDDNDNDENDAVERSAAFQELSKSLPQVLSAIYTGSSSSNNVDPLETTSSQPQQQERLVRVNKALQSRHRSITFQSRVERLQPKTKEIKKYGKTYTETETLEEARARVHRTDRHVERDKMAQRWQNRKINYTLEEDVGNVFEKRVKKVLGPKFRREAKQLAAAARQKEEQIKQESRQRAVDYDSEDEQNQLLDRLTQEQKSMAIDKEEDKVADQEAAAAVLDPSIPFKDQVDFWEYGKALPSKDELAQIDFEKLCRFRPVPAIAIEAEEPARKLTPTEKRLLRSQTISLTKYFDGRPQTKTETPEPRYFFPKTLGNPEKLDRFGHLRHFRVIAMRQLCSQSLDEGRENRLIRNLLVKRTHGRIVGPVANFTPLPTYQTMTHQLAANLLLYYQHSWTDPELVAEQLGLTGDLAGFTGAAVHVAEFFKGRREFVKKQYCREKKCMTFDSSNVTVEKGKSGIGQKNHPDKASPALSDDDESQTSAVDAETGTVQQQNLLPESGLFGELIPPTSLFAHIPGTKAPVPQMPLEPAGMLFGPVDKHAKFFHKSKINETTSRLIVSKFLSRIMAEQQSNESFVENDNTRKAQKDLKTFLEEYVQIHSTKSSHIFGRMHGMKDVASVHYYKSLMSYCSLLVSGIPLEASSSSSDFKVENNDDDMYATEGVRKQAADITNVLESHVDRSEVAKFPRLRIVFSLAQIAASLPESAAELLSQAIDGEDIRTPLDLFKETLEHMEEREMIVSQKEFPDDDTVDVGNLEYLFFRASKRLQENIQVDALDMDHHLWYIGALASSLLLCSGNKIGGGAHIHPSGKSRTRGYGYCKSLPHEVRHKLPKFNEMRQALSSATKMLFQLADYQKGPRVHLAVCSLLDWKEVVALLGGAATPSNCDGICRLYRHHAKEWTLSEGGREFWNRLENKDRACELELLAQRLENKPGNIETWRKFVQKVGPLGSKNPTNRDESPDCPPSMWLRDGRIVRQSNDWWGKSRKWWMEGLLHMDLKPTARWPACIKAVIEKLESNMPECALCASQLQRDRDDPRDSEESSTSWLPFEEAESVRESDESTKEDRVRSFDDKLPNRTVPPDRRHIQEDVEDVEEEEGMNCDGDNVEFRLPNLGASALGVELQCFKTFLFAHLNVDDLFKVEALVQSLVVGCAIGHRKNFAGTINTESADFHALEWLCYVGLDIPKMLRKDLELKYARAHPGKDDTDKLQQTRGRPQRKRVPAKRRATLRQKTRQSQRQRTPTKSPPPARQKDDSNTSKKSPLRRSPRTRSKQATGQDTPKSRTRSTRQAYESDESETSSDSDSSDYKGRVSSSDEDSDD